MTLVRDTLHFDENEKTFTIQSRQDVEPILESVKANVTGGKNKAGDLYLAGSFPPVVVLAWLKARGLDLRDFGREDVRREFLNDDAHSAFRVWKGRV